jgi:hypothetical protein
MPVFESSADDPLGLWNPTLSTEALSFGLGDESNPSTGPVYRVNLPASAAESARIMDGTETAFAQIETALDQVPARLDGLVQRTRENIQRKSTTLSFDVSSEEQETGLEGDLLSQLADVDRTVLGVGKDGEVSFGLGETIGDVFSASKKQFDALITQIDRDVLHFAWVETIMAGQLIARTIVDWSGDAQTVWQDGCSDEQAILHQRNLWVVTKTRGLRFRLFITASSGAAKVASLMVTPGGAVLALPAVYQYVMKILAQTRELQSI